MKIEHTELVPKSTIREVVEARDRALKYLEEAHELVQKANEECKKATFSSTHSTFSMNTLQYIGGGKSFYTSFGDRARRELDKRVWWNLLNATPLGDAFNAKTSDAFYRQIDREPPEVTLENITATMLDLAARAGDMFEQSVYDRYKGLSSNYRTNEGFGFGNKIILTGVMESSGISYWHEEEVRDLDRIFHVVDGKPAPERYGGLIGAIKTARKERGGYGSCQGEGESDYFAFKWYKNGNMHITFKDQELVDTINLILNKHHEKELVAEKER